MARPDKPARPPMPRWAKRSFCALALIMALAVIAKLSGHGSHMGMH